jgi:hypothetical protein
MAFKNDVADDMAPVWPRLATRRAPPLAPIGHPVRPRLATPSGHPVWPPVRPPVGHPVRPRLALHLATPSGHPVRPPRPATRRAPRLAPVRHSVRPPSSRKIKNKK